MSARILGFVVVATLAGCRRGAPSTTVFVTNEDSGDVTVIDAARDEVTRTIPVGKRPRGTRLSPDKKTLFVAVSGAAKSGGPSTNAAIAPRAHDASADGIAVVDVDRGTVVRVIESGPDPESFDVSADGRTLYVSNEDDATLAVVDVASGKVTERVAVGPEPEGVAVAPSGDTVYVTSEASDRVDVVRIPSNEVVAHLPTAKRPRGIAFDPRTGRAFVTAELGGTVHVLDAKTHAVIGAPVHIGEGTRPMGIALSPDGARAFVTTGSGGSVVVVDPATQAVERTIPNVGKRPWGIAVTPDGRKLYVATGDGVAVVDANRGEVTKHIAAGRGTWGVTTR